MRTTWKIELKIDLVQGDEEGKAILTRVMREAAQQIFAQAVMMSDKRKPQIAVTADNHFEGPEVIDMNLGE